MRTAVGLAEPEDRAAELARLRECLWFRLALGAYREHSLNDHLIGQFRDVGQQLAEEGTRAKRHRPWRRWGQWLQTAGRRLSEFAREVEAAR